MTTEIKKQRGNPNWGVCKSYSEVREAIKPMKFKTMNEYREWVVKNNIEGFPINPYATYSRRNEFISTRHFLGKTDTVKPIHKEDEGIVNKFSFHSIRTIIKQLMGRA